MKQQKPTGGVDYTALPGQTLQRRMLTLVHPPMAVAQKPGTKMATLINGTEV